MNKDDISAFAAVVRKKGVETTPDVRPPHRLESVCRGLGLSIEFVDIGTAKISGNASPADRDILSMVRPIGVRLMFADGSTIPDFHRN